jgi:hypothetical protein
MSSQKSKSRHDQRPVNQYVLVPSPLGIKWVPSENFQKLFTVICTLLKTFLVTTAVASIDGYLVTVLTYRIVMLLIQQYNIKTCFICVPSVIPTLQPLVNNSSVGKISLFYIKINFSSTVYFIKFNSAFNLHLP